MRLRGKILSAGSGAKTALGIVLLVIGLLVLSGFDTRAEAALLDEMPDWVVALTTRF